jgi:hypothetical protein
MEKSMNIKVGTLATLLLRLMSVYIGLSGLQTLRYSYSTFQVFEFSELAGLLALTVLLPLAVGTALWSISPFLAAKVLPEDGGSEQEVHLALAPDTLFSIGIKLVAVLYILKGMPAFLATSFALFQQSQVDPIVLNQMKVWCLVNALNLLLCGYLLVYTRHFLSLINRDSRGM